MPGPRDFLAALLLFGAGYAVLYLCCILATHIH